MATDQQQVSVELEAMRKMYALIIASHKEVLQGFATTLAAVNGLSSRIDEMLAGPQPQAVPDLVAARAPEPAPVQQAAASGALSVIVNRYEVKPEVNDRVTILFYAEGHKYADVRCAKWQLQRARELLAGVAPTIDLTRPADVTMAAPGWRVVYTLGKEFVSESGKTGQYKDVQRVELP